MKISILIFAVAILLAACGKNGSTNNQVIDVASQQCVDPFGNPLYPVGPGPYYGNRFTAEELALFNSLDTANLNGTSVPSATINIGLYPNPSFDSAAFYLFHEFGTGFTGNMVEKIVITDSTLNPVYKGSLIVNGPTMNVAVMPTIVAGRFRMFITLSAQGNDNFYTYWVNITRQN
jgi:hypothetical protein